MQIAIKIALTLLYGHYFMQIENEIIYNLTFSENKLSLEKMISPMTEKIVVLPNFQLRWNIVDSCEIVPTKFLKDSVEIFHLTDRIGACTNLSMLTLVGVHLVDLPEPLFTLNKLNSLDISYTNIDVGEYREKITKLKQLTHLNIRGCKFTELDIQYLKNQCPQLEILYTDTPLLRKYERDLKIFDTYIVFRDSILRMQFIETCPKEIRPCIRLGN